MRVAYVLNTYPAGSQTFIRREIRALEALGVLVQRIALRGWDAAIVDPRDKDERDQTHYILRHGITALAGPVLRTLLRNPIRLLRGVAQAVALSRLSERGLPYHWPTWGRLAASLNWPAPCRPITCTRISEPTRLKW
jgi:colanic acid/amylovoran biosynthesis glycosyltransferase